MQELRLVAVSEDGSYLVLATAGRGTRFTLPVDDRLRAAVRGHFSRLGQFEIEVESPLRPKEIQARIRAGETAEEIAESAGIPVERVRWFEGPVLQEREYMAQQAQRVVVRRQGETSPGPPLGEIVENRLGRRGVDLEEIAWDSWKCEDNTWRVRLSFFIDGRPYAAEWVFDPRRRQLAPLDEEAAQLSSIELENTTPNTVTPFVPRRPAMKVVSADRADVPALPRPPRAPAPPEDSGGLEEILSATQEPRETLAPAPPAPASRQEATGPRRGADEQTIDKILTEPPIRTEPAYAEPSRIQPPRIEPPRIEPVRAEPPRTEQPAASAAPDPEARPEQAPELPAEPAAKLPEPATGPTEQVAEERTEQVPEVPVEKAPEPVVTAANGRTASSPAKPPAGTPAKTPAQPARNRRKGSAKGKRASVPSWDEIMFGARRPE